MKFQLYSDTHIEFGHSKYPIYDGTSDYLLLAGDVGLTKKYEQMEDFFNKVASQDWKKIFVIMGNHEAYRSLYQQSLSDMKALADDTGVIFLDNEPHYLDKGVWIFGGTMWTDLSNPVHNYSARITMNDYQIIKWFNGTNYFKLNPDITTRMFWEFKEALDLFLTHMQNDEKVIVMSHTAPHANSSLSCYRGNANNPAYFTDMTEFFGEKIPYWVHGHMHNKSDYSINGTRVLANPYGYNGQGVFQINQEFDEKGFGFDV